MLTVGHDYTFRIWQLAVDAEPVSDRAQDKQEWANVLEPSRQPQGLQVRWSSLRADGKIALSLAPSVSGRELIRLIDPASGRLLGRPAAHRAGWRIAAAVFSPDGRSFATGGDPYQGIAGEVRLWDATTGRLRLGPLPHTNYVRALAFAPDGKVIAAGDYNGLVRFWNTTTGREVGRPLAQREIVLDLAYSPDGKILAVGLAKDRTGKPGVRLWDTTTGRAIGELLSSTADVNRIEFRPDGRRACCRVCELICWRVRTLRPALGHEPRRRSAR